MPQLTPDRWVLASRQYFERSVASMRRAIAMPPHGAGVREFSLLMSSLSRLGDLSYLAGDLSGALEWYRQARESVDTAMAVQPDRVRRWLPNLLLRQSDSYLAMGDANQAFGNAMQALQVTGELLQCRSGAGYFLRATQISAQGQVVNVLFGRMGSLGRKDEAIQHFREGLRTNEELLSSDPNDAQARRQFTSLVAKAARLLRLITVSEGLALTRRAVAFAAEISAANPEDVDSRAAEADVRVALAERLEASGETAGADAEFQKALSMLSPLFSKAPFRADLRLSVAVYQAGRAAVTKVGPPGSRAQRARQSRPASGRPALLASELCRTEK